jgi:PAS domain S-box-containing protein
MLGYYDLKLVALSIAVAIIASYVALDLAGRVSASSARKAAIWLAAGAVSMGFGIWSMHFIGMLAFHLPVPVAFNLPITLLSMLIAVVVSAIALFVLRRPQLGIPSLTLGGTLMGIGIASMHYTGMIAMQMSPPIHYDLTLFAASILIAIGASFVALWIAFRLRARRSTNAILMKLGSACVMGLAIAGMHYTGMAAARFAPGSVCLAAASGGIDHTGLAAAIAGTTLAIMCLTLILSAMDSHLGEMQRKYRGLLDAAPDAMVVVDEQGKILLMNAQAKKQFGYRRAELVGQPVTRIIPTGFAERLVADAARTPAEAASQQIGMGIELAGRRKDGSEFPIELLLSPQQSAEGLLVTAGIRDLSRRKDAEMQKGAAEASNRAKSIFLATMSHELRTPMNGLLGMLELLSLTKLDAAQSATLDVMRESGRSLQGIIDDILDFSKIEAGKLEVRPEATSIAAAVEGVRNLYSGNASSKGVLLTCRVDARISPALMVDAMRLRQILNNLVSNALKFTHDGGYIKVTAELAGRADGQDRVRFSVEDSGIGISAEDQARLFQPFAQATNESAPLAGGTGLGLTICRQLAKLMGGSIEMVSAPGKGTTMIVELSLPIADQKAVASVDPVGTLEGLVTTAARRRAAPGVAEAMAEGTLVLLADDHPTNRLVLARQVSMLGYAVECAENGVDALARWKSGGVGIVITDCNMPEMDGYELARRIRGIESGSGGKRVPIVACTANAMEGVAQACMDAGMDDYLAKPIKLKSLAEKLDQWLPLAQRAAPVDRPLPAMDVRLVE